MMKPVRSLSILLAACLLALAGCADDAAPATPNGTAGGGAGGSHAGGAGAGGAPAAGTTATAAIASLPGQTLTGTATFSSSAAGVMLQLSLQNCPPGDHPFHIHQGSACTDMTTQMGHWDGDGMPDMPTRGEGITPITCAADGTGTVSYTRPSTAAANLAWTIGGDVTTNVKGHVIVVHMSSTDKTRLACGLIN
jgi:Cu/Zn superoxide dismutase